MAYSGLDYDLVCSVHLWSHVLPWGMGRCRRMLEEKEGGTKIGKESDEKKMSWTCFLSLCFVGLLSFPLCLWTCRFVSSPAFFSLLSSILPSSMKKAIFYMFPIHEMMESYNIVSAFYTTPQKEKVLHDMLKHLLFVTVHIQFGLGHIGIDFLTSEQKRKNMLIRMDLDNPPPSVENGKGTEKRGKDEQGGARNETKFDPSRKFRRSAPTFILLTVLPYMFQIILFGNLNNFSFMYVRNQIHNSVRIDELFQHVSLVSC